MQWWYNAGMEAGRWIEMIPLGALFWLLALAIGLFIWVKRTQEHARAFEAESNRREQAVRVLDDRFARGEIDRDEYLQKRRDLFA